MNVRFEGNNGHDADVTRCLLLTLSGHHNSRRPLCFQIDLSLVLSFPGYSRMARLREPFLISFHLVWARVGEEPEKDD